MDADENYSLKIEAEEVIKEIKYAVNSVELSKVLQSTDEYAFFNLETKENHQYCVELSPKGFRLAGKQFDVLDQQEGESKFYETIYSMLDSISPGYRNTFGDTLIQKLQGLHSMQRSEGSADS
ncbi:GSK3B-interacting protein-like [Mercenaria mercenaria]|uniref:GSK3B-interacting protein-like n=1 Tax=Mercenaria mercenaria TaxID=6596 RepID=UPI001E1D8BDA|nr:GSK3B-interacting protein-like [Mercenaria mercenaria]